MAKKAIQHGRKNVKPDKSHSPQQQQDSAQQQQPFMVPPPVPGVDAPGQDLGFNAPNGPGFAPH